MSLSHLQQDVLRAAGASQSGIRHTRKGIPQKDYASACAALVAAGFLKQTETKYWITPEGRAELKNINSDTKPLPPVAPEDEAKLSASLKVKKAKGEWPARIQKMLTMMRRKAGASIIDLMAETKFKRYTVRGRVHDLRKSGLDIASKKVDGVTHYFIESSAK